MLHLLRLQIGAVVWTIKDGPLFQIILSWWDFIEDQAPKENYYILKQELLLKVNGTN